MIPFDFEYHKPSSLSDAYILFKQLESANKNPLYYAGGTEIISMARAGSLKFGSVIDLKSLPECTDFILYGNNLVIGSAVTLTEIAERNLFPLLSDTVKRIADHTIQDKITLGGNLAGTIIYRESALPLLITNSRARVMTESGVMEMPFTDIFKGKLNLKKGDFLVQITIDNDDLNLPCNHVKKTKIEKIDYPLITLTAVKKENTIKAAVSGLAYAPMVLPDVLLNDNTAVDNVINTVRSDIITDLSGSKEYREFVLKNILNQMINNFKEVKQ